MRQAPTAVTTVGFLESDVLEHSTGSQRFPGVAVSDAFITPDGTSTLLLLAISLGISLGVKSGPTTDSPSTVLVVRVSV